MSVYRGKRSSLPDLDANGLLHLPSDFLNFLIVPRLSAMPHSCFCTPGWHQAAERPNDLSRDIRPLSTVPALTDARRVLTFYLCRNILFHGYRFSSKTNKTKLTCFLKCCFADLKWVTSVSKRSDTTPKSDSAEGDGYGSERWKIHSLAPLLCPPGSQHSKALRVPEIPPEASL